MNPSPLASWQQYSLFFISFLLVSLGQPVWSQSLALIVAAIGFACFWRGLLTIESKIERFFIAMGWFTSVQIIQLIWFVSHPYGYIYAVLLLCSWIIGFQWGILAIWITPQTFRSWSSLLALAGLWVCLEMSRLWIFTGFPFNALGLTLSAGLYPLQFASIGGIYGLSFWVILTNLLALRAWLNKKKWQFWALWGSVALFPYAFGWLHFHGQQAGQLKNPQTIQVALVQSALPIEESLHFQSADEAIDFVLGEWKHVLQTLVKQQNQTIDLIVFPEYLVPYGTYHAVFPVEKVNRLFAQLFNSKPIPFPPLREPYASWVETPHGFQWFVNNAYLSQTVANFFNAHVVIGLEDSLVLNEKLKTKELYSSAFHFPPQNQPAGRYEKRILVPMGEYIPFSWCRQLAARYGISGSFTCGKEAQVFQGPVPFGTSICYEELYGDLMRENRLKGAELLVNLTNDGWYPRSSLPQQHFDHARLRTVENGIPLVRSCNTGITGAVDSLGQVVAVLGDGSLKAQETADSLLVKVPTYHYLTFYSQYGDKPVLIASFLCLLGGLVGSLLYKKL